MSGPDHGGRSDARDVLAWDDVDHSDDAAGAADRAWQIMAHYVIDNRGPWKRSVTERTGLSFNTIRLLRRIAARPRSISELAESVGVDSPAASVAISQLEADGLVTRHIDPDNRRRKIVSVTDAGEAMVRTAMSTADPAPRAFEALSDDEVAELHRLVAKLEYIGRDVDPTRD